MDDKKKYKITSQRLTLLLLSVGIERFRIEDNHRMSGESVTGDLIKKISIYLSDVPVIFW